MKGLAPFTNRNTAVPIGYRSRGTPHRRISSDHSPSHPCLYLPRRRVRAALDIPDRYGIPMVVSTGYPAPPKHGKDGAGGRSAKRWRYPAEEVVFDGSFGIGMAGVDPVVL